MHALLWAYCTNTTEKSPSGTAPPGEGDDEDPEEPPEDPPEDPPLTVPFLSVCFPLVL
jgi:hypothetical protein